MIEVNLLQKKKKTQLPVIFGVIDLNVINFKMLVFVLVLYYLSDMLVAPILSTSESDIQVQIDALNVKLKNIKKETRDSKNVKAKLQMYNKQFERLQRRSAQVDEIIKKRTNPKKLLEKIARDIPSEVWIDRLEITSDRKVLIEGGAEEYISIGSFIKRAQEALFFEENEFEIKKSVSVEDKLYQSGKRIEQFSLVGKIKTFDPWNE